MEYNFNTRPYIVLNGENSQTIPGLIISKLPKISKPLQRTLVETVDGRDGDIVTELGYAAYDKTLEIGLSYEYNIDDIIEFFNGSGKVVFSNEPDKYYFYAIYNQIDFEKLIRFKTATVTLHVQPFKYSDNESEKKFTLTPGSPSPISIRNNGNIYSKPTITITGSGDINFFINSRQILTITLPAIGQTIVINASEMNAYSADGATFLNRLVNGNYNDIKLKVGKNEISYTGSVSEIRIDNYTRWI